MRPARTPNPAPRQNREMERRFLGATGEREERPVDRDPSIAREACVRARKPRRARASDKRPDASGELRYPGTTEAARKRPRTSSTLAKHSPWAGRRAAGPRRSRTCPSLPPPRRSMPERVAAAGPPWRDAELCTSNGASTPPSPPVSPSPAPTTSARTPSPTRRTNPRAQSVRPSNHTNPRRRRTRPPQPAPELGCRRKQAWTEPPNTTKTRPPGSTALSLACPPAGQQTGRGHWRCCAIA